MKVENAANNSKVCCNEVHDENILVVKRDKLFEEIECWQGLKEVDFVKFLKTIDSEKEFLPRSKMELDMQYKQIIPYLVFNHEDKYFLMQRKSTSTEQRLKNKYSLGIGGHIRQEDLASNDIIDWAKREFEEEVNFSGKYSVKPLGILNDDSNPVGQVHIGFVFLLVGDCADISVKSELKGGSLFTLQECEFYYQDMETWTQLVFDFLKVNNSY